MVDALTDDGIVNSCYKNLNIAGDNQAITTSFRRYSLWHSVPANWLPPWSATVFHRVDDAG